MSINFECPKCSSSFYVDDDSENLYEHIKECLRGLSCPKCEEEEKEDSDEDSDEEEDSDDEEDSDEEGNKRKFTSENELIDHYLREHATQLRNGEDVGSRGLICPKCDDEDDDENKFTSEDELINHYLREHANQGGSNGVQCPRCDDSPDIKDGDAFIKHLELIHSVLIPTGKGGEAIDDDMRSKLPKEGDKIIAMWGQSKWQYFTARIKSFHTDQMKYEIDWDDGDTTGRIVDVENIALDRMPDEDELGVGTVVLFPQGSYTAGNSQETGGKRWHQGIITEVAKDDKGVKRYKGHHTKTGDDGKFCSYKDFSHEFTEYSKHDFRLAPNVFDIIHFEDDNDDHEDIDVFLSYDMIDSPKAFVNHEITKPIPASYTTFGYENMCDPARIEDFLREQGLKVARQTRTGQQELKEVASLIKNAKVFIGCLSDHYVANNQLKMEFSYAKTTLRKPTIPIVVGEGSFKWMSSMIGMLIAGELFIHFRGKDIEDDKNAELLMNLRKFIPVEGEGVEAVDESVVKSAVDAGPPDIFLSYCWSNSQYAQDAKQINKVNGTKLSDPRFLKKKLTERGYNVWLDVEQLNSANADAGLFGQIVEGLKSSKLVIPCISEEYAKSQNCRMEFQFAMKSIFKPAVPLVVGHGDEWRGTVIGALLATHEQTPIDLQGMEDEELLKERLSRLFESIESIIGKKDKVDEQSSSDESTEEEDETDKERRALKQKSRAPKQKSRAPKVGDHVVSHHQKFSYYMATVVKFDMDSMMYTVDWDDGDPTGRVQGFDQVAMDTAPDVDDIGVGSIIFFPQGSYGGTDGNNTGGVRYHEGEVTSVDKTDPDDITVSGHHTKTEADGKWESSDYKYHFACIQLEDVRLAPTALEAMLL